MLQHYALTQANAQDASPLTIRWRTVDFPHQNRWKKKRPEMEKNGSTRDCTPPPPPWPRRMQPLSKKCKRAHVCKSCQGDHSVANCPLSTRSSLSVSNWRLAWHFTYPPGLWFCKRNYYTTLILAFVLVLIMIVPLDFLKLPLVRSR